MAKNRNPAAAGNGGSTNGFPSGTTRVELTQADRFRQHALPSTILANLISAQPSARVWGRRDLSWHKDGSALVLCVSGAELLRVVPDARFTGMWRVVCHGRLLDTANLGWA